MAECGRKLPSLSSRHGGLFLCQNLSSGKPHTGFVLGVTLFWLLFLLCIQNVSSFPVPTSSKTFRTLKDDNPKSGRRSNPQQLPGRELFQKGPYVPLGLTQEEFEKIKQEEHSEHVQKEFGAWGPRFKRTDTPGGDWLLMPNLWITGSPKMNKNSTKISTSATMESVSSEKSYQDEKSFVFAARARNAVVKTGPALAMSYVLINTFLFSMAMMRMQQAPQHATVRNIIQWGLQQVYMGMQTIGGRAPVHIKISKLVCSVALMPLMKKAVKYFERKWDWEPQHMLLVTMAMSLGAVCFIAWTSARQLSQAW